MSYTFIKPVAKKIFKSEYLTSVNIILKIFLNVLQLSRRTMLAGFIVLAFCIGVAAWTMVKIDSRWSRFVATVPVAWDVQSDHAWLDILKRGLPVAADGRPVEATAYERRGPNASSSGSSSRAG